MATLFSNLAVPAGDGVGAGSDLGTMGALRTITVKGTFTGTVTIEISNDGGTSYVPLHSFTAAKQKTFKVAADYMRVRRSGVVVPAGTPNVDVGGDDIGSSFDNLPVTAGDGTGAAVDVSALGSFNTIIVSGSFTGSVTVEMSLDNTDWLPVAGFSAAGHVSKKIVARYLRVVRSGVGLVPGTPIVNVGAENTPILVLGNGQSFIVADLTELAALVATGLPNGTEVYVTTLDDVYYLDLVGAHTPDGLDIIAALGTAGYWIAQTQGRWDDIFGDISQGDKKGELTNEDFRDTAWRTLFFRHDQDNSLHYAYQFSHKWKTTTAVHPHIHVIPMADPGAPQDAYFSGYYAWSYAGAAAVPALAGWTAFTATLTVDPGDVYIQQILELGEWSPPGYAGASTCLLIMMMREGTNVLDTYSTNKDHGTAAANLAIISSDVHYRADKMGTLTEYI